ncbi:hypothetical protein LCGC14_3031940, partial [marine sediment metagenome]
MRAVLKGLAVALACAAPGGLAAQELTALARVDPVESTVKDGWFGKTDLTVALSQGVPFRVFLLDDPARLIVDFREADWSEVARGDLLAKPGRISALRYGAFQPGWSRLVADLAEPMVPAEIGMPVDAASGKARLEITLESVDAEVFAKAAGVPIDPDWTSALTAPPKPPVAGKDIFTVVLD